MTNEQEINKELIAENDINKNLTMTIEEEERFLLDKLQSTRHMLKLHKEEDNLRELTKNRLEKELTEIEQASIDYMVGNGLLQTENFTLGHSASIEVEDIESVPEQFVRTKITKEANKILIKELMPKANWYSVKKSNFITIRGN